MSARLGSLLLTLLVLTTALAGCHGLGNGDDGDDGTGPGPTPTGSPGASPTPGATPNPTGTPTPPPEPQGPDVTLTIVGAPSNITAGDPISFNVTVSGDEVTATSAGIAYAFDSTTPTARENLTLADFNGTHDGEGDLAFPGTYAIVNWTVDTNRTLFVRAHIVVDGSDHWSDEVLITVNEPDADPVVGETHTVPIRARVPMVCELDRYDVQNGPVNPGQLSIKVNDAVVWVNEVEDCIHGVEWTGSNPPGEDIPELGSGETSDPIVFTRTGTFEYRCPQHPTTMRGSINVQ